MEYEDKGENEEQQHQDEEYSNSDIDITALTYFRVTHFSLFLLSRKPREVGSIELFKQ